MAIIKPFKALVYNRQIIKDLSKVICPPYDVVSPARQQYFHSLDQHNLLHIELGKDTPQEDKYARAGDLFAQWQKTGVLVDDDKPAFYFYSHEYGYRGEKRIRLGFIGLLRLDNERSSVFGHENTHTEAKEDRLKIIRQVKANLSPIFVLFADQKRIVQRVYQQSVIGKKPFIEAADDERNIHRVWKIDSADAIGLIESGLADERVFIADGHHRYEVACAYREEMKHKTDPSVHPESLNYIMAYFTNTESRGLTVMPIHRLVRLPAPFEVEKFNAAARDFFEFEPLKDRRRFFFLLEKGGRSEHVIGVYSRGQYGLLRLKNVKIVDKFINDKPPEYRSLDVAILNYMVFRKVLGIDPQDSKVVSYTQETDELLAQADKDPCAAAFLLNAVKVEQIMSVALAGSKMPPKSTFFYPKVASGLVVNKLGPGTA